jgi:hypothetical protein
VPFRRLAFLEVASLGLAVVYSAATVVFVLSRGSFYGDDFSGFLVSRTEPFASGLFIPVGGQVVPMARLLDSVFFHVVGLRYGAAVATLCAFHLIGIVYLYRTLNLLRPSAANAVLIALYACYVHTWVQLGWWIAGLERVPFVAFASLALYHYVRYSETRARRHLAAVCVCDLLALGFYSKALLLPLCMVGLDVARFSASDLRARLRTFAGPWLVAAVLLVVGATCSVLEHRAAGTLATVLGGAPAGQVVEFTELGLVFFAHSLFGLSFGVAPHATWLLVALLWLSLVGYTSVRARRAWVAWLVLLALVLTNLVMIGVSSRVALFGPLLALEVRYYWELCFFSCVLLGVILHRVRKDTAEGEWVRRTPGVAQGVVAAFCVLYAAVSYRQFSSSALPDSAAMWKSRKFMDTLSADMKRLNSREAPVKLADDNVPAYLIGMDLTFLRVSQLLFLMRERVAWVLPEKAEYRIAVDGHLVRISRRPRRH